MTLLEIKEIVEKLSREKLFERARRLSSSWPEPRQEQVVGDAESGKFDEVFVDSCKELKAAKSDRCDLVWIGSHGEYDWLIKRG